MSLHVIMTINLTVQLLEEFDVAPYIKSLLTWGHYLSVKLRLKKDHIKTF